MKNSLTLPSIIFLFGYSPIIQAKDLTSVEKLTSSESNELVTSIENLNDQAQEHTNAIEILEAAQASENKKVQNALKQYRNNSKRISPLAKWLPALHGGDAEKGKEIFLNHPKAQCTQCHAGSEISNKLGPDLTGIASQFNHSRRDLLASLVTPSSSIAEGYGTINVEFEEGQVKGKILAYQSSGLIVELDGKPRLISHGDYKHVHFENSSMLPATQSLNLREVRDLVAYLATLTGTPNTSVVQNLKATPFKLSELTKKELAQETDETIEQKRLYQTNCAVCHGLNGEGTETFPPLAGSEWVSSDKETLIQMQLRGLQGPIKVKGKVYDGLIMPSNAHLPDKDLASILTYIRTDPAFENNASEVTSEEIVEARAAFAHETGILDASTLKHPDLRAKEQPQSGPIIVKKKQNNDSSSYLGYIIGFIILCLIPVVIGFVRNNKSNA